MLQTTLGILIKQKQVYTCVSSLTSVLQFKLKQMVAANYLTTTTTTLYYPFRSFIQLVKR